MSDWERVQGALAQGAVCLVEVVATQGSAPRGAGAWMAVTATQTMGTIGGGHLEWQAMQMARAWLQQGMAGDAQLHRLALGPSLGQCCGGAVEIRCSALSAHTWAATQARLQSPRATVALFGAGHVGQALVHMLQPLPLDVVWVDSREALLPSTPLPHVQCEHSEPVQAAVPHLPAQSLVLVMSFSHAEDLDIVAACLQRQRTQGDLPFVGLIGSATKWAVFQRRLLARGFSAAEVGHITCPIGVPGIPGKEPAAIAVAVAAQLLQQRAQLLSLN